MEEDVEIELEVDRSCVERETQFTLVGKILAKKTLNKRGVMRVLQNTWSTKEVKVIKELGVNLYAIFSKVNRV